MYIATFNKTKVLMTEKLGSNEGCIKKNCARFRAQPLTQL